MSLFTVEHDTSGRVVKFTMPRYSNFHGHVRWIGMIDDVAPELMRHVFYLLCMGNNGPGEGGIIRSIADAQAVYDKLMSIRAKHDIRTLENVLIAVYHTADITPKVVEEMSRSHLKLSVKNYPGHGGTTNSGHGIPFDEHPELALACMEHKVRRLFHAEDVVGLDGRPLPHAEREAHCIKHRMWKYRDKYPGLICIEHASTREAIEFVKADTSGNTVMTVTPQHLLFTAEDFKTYSWRNHLRCMPYVKTEEDRQALLEFVTSGDPRCIAGDDSAPHPAKKKNVTFEEAACGCWMPHSAALYALAFMQMNALDDRFVNFMSMNGPHWWKLRPPSTYNRISIVEEVENDIPDPTPLPAQNDVVIPLGWSESTDRLKVGYATALTE